MRNYEYVVTVVTTQQTTVSIEAEDEKSARAILDDTIDETPEKIDDMADVLEERFFVLPMGTEPVIEIGE